MAVLLPGQAPPRALMPCCPPARSHCDPRVAGLQRRGLRHAGQPCKWNAYSMACSSAYCRGHLAPQADCMRERAGNHLTEPWQ